jgi:hypothetical protein
LQIIYKLKCNTLARAAADHVLRQRSLYAVRQADISSLDAEEGKEKGKEGYKLGDDMVLDTEMKEGTMSDVMKVEKDEKEKREREGYADGERECRLISEEEGEGKGEGVSTSGILSKSIQNMSSESPQVARVPTYRNVTSDAQYNGKGVISVVPLKNLSVSNGTEKTNGKKSPSYMSGTSSTNNAKVQKPQVVTAKPKKKRDSPNKFIYQSNFSAFEQQQGCFWVEEIERGREKEGGRKADLFKYIREEKKMNIDFDSNSQNQIQITHTYLKSPTVGPSSRPSPHSTDNPPSLVPINHPSSPHDPDNTPRRRLSDFTHPVYNTPSKAPEPPPIPTYSSWIETQPGRRKSEPSGAGNNYLGVGLDGGDVFGSVSCKDIGAESGLESAAGTVVLRYGAPLAARRSAESARVVPVIESVLKAAEGHVSDTNGADVPMRQPSLHDMSRLNNVVPSAGRGRDRGRDKGRVDPFKPTPVGTRVRVQVPALVPLSAHTDSRGKVHPPWSGETDF